MGNIDSAVSGHSVPLTEICYGNIDSSVSGHSVLLTEICYGYH